MGSMTALDFHAIFNQRLLRKGAAVDISLEKRKSQGTLI